MNDQQFEFRFEGPGAEAEARALAAFLGSEFPDWPARLVPRPPPGHPEAHGTREAATTIALVSLLLALPSGVKDGLELAERLKLKEKLRRLIAWAKQRRPEQNPFAVLPPHGLKVPLHQAQPEQLLVALTHPTAQGKPQKP